MQFYEKSLQTCLKETHDQKFCGNYQRIERHQQNAFGIVRFYQSSRLYSSNNPKLYNRTAGRTKFVELTLWNMEIPTQIFCVLIFENFSRASTVRIFLLKVEDLNYVLRFEHYIFHSDLRDNVYGQESCYKPYILLQYLSPILLQRYSRHCSTCETVAILWNYRAKKNSLFIEAKQITLWFHIVHALKIMLFRNCIRLIQFWNFLSTFLFLFMKYF